LPDSNDATLRPEPKDGSHQKLPFNIRRFMRGLSHDVGRRGHLKPQHIAIAVLVVVAGTWAATEIHNRMTHVSENDARISAKLIPVSSRVAGWVTKILVSEGDRMKVGQVMVQIDSRESQLVVRELEAQRLRIQADRTRLRMEKSLADSQTSSRYKTRQSALSAARAAVSSLKPQLDLARANLARSESLFAKKVIPRRQIDEARTTVRKVQSDHRGAIAQLQQAQAELQEASADRARLEVIEGEIEMLRHQESELEARVERQKLDLSDRTIRAPINGVVDKTFVEEGQYVTPGQRLAIVHDPNQIWIDANIKETEVRKLHVGHSVEVFIDAYPDGEFIGTIATIGNSTTSEYALLPTPNPSGNFTKITQRLPVRIAIKQKEQKLRPGMMVEVRIDIRSK
jgi:membrane fusion protein (multidrug efflux system)